jgi:hypothetical protein
MAFLCVDPYEGVDTIDDDDEVLEACYGDAIWDINQCPLTSHIQCSTLQNTTNYYCIARIITKLTTIMAFLPLLILVCHV